MRFRDVQLGLALLGAGLIVAGAAAADLFTLDLHDRQAVLAAFNSVPGRHAIEPRDWDEADAYCSNGEKQPYHALGFSSVDFKMICVPARADIGFAKFVCNDLSRAFVAFDPEKQVITCSGIMAGKRSA